MPQDDLTDAKIARAAAESDTKIARMEGKIDTLAATLAGKIDSLSSDISRSRSEAQENKRAVIGTIVGSAFAIAGLLAALAVYGDALFGRGMNVRDVIQTTIKDYQATQPKQP